ncbi:MFS transporter [Cryobacterium frigoriphilum]|uniref:MFS transporter n=1 Tax=Cryobacterium frigoriphilum TaxID=1259150 RepID=UPI001068F6FC|nr:MFS transporter [Cryobacterium frigoriphilum]
MVIIRRIFYSWQFAAVAVLPLWLLIGSAIFGTGGWAVLGVFFGAVALGLSLLVVALLVYARKEVRSSRTVSWPDVGVLTLWHGLIIGIGFAESASGWLSVLVVFVGIGAFWFALWELYDAARKRMRAMIDLVEQQARPPAGPPRQTPLSFPNTAGHPSSTTPAPPGPRPGRTDPEVIVIQEKPTQP